MGVISGYQLIVMGQKGPAAPTDRLRRLLSSIHMVNHRYKLEKTPDPIPEESSSPGIGSLLNDVWMDDNSLLSLPVGAAGPFWPITIS
ncbi:hypothetical protein QQF64_007483 [Cirrhinus molitorella]|uniref:Uncharacterized protein n=1 Tax=Cirrhinus molitorella TaxID=172907 RepID=A0ABR3MEV4_9TELE